MRLIASLLFVVLGSPNPLVCIYQIASECGNSVDAAASEIGDTLAIREVKRAHYLVIGRWIGLAAGRGLCLYPCCWWPMDPWEHQGPRWGLTELRRAAW